MTWKKRLSSNDGKFREGGSERPIPEFSPLNDLQIRTLAENYTKNGVIYESNDVHTMLDCGPEPTMPFDTGPYRPRTLTLEGSYASVPAVMVPASRGRLRQEFFGGMFYDSERNRLFNFDHLGFQLFYGSWRVGRVEHLSRILQRKGYAASEINAGLQQLLDAGLLKACIEGDATSSPEITFFPAYDLSISYLQTPFVVEIEGTHACYRRCVHCAYDAAPDVDRSNDLTTEQWCLIIDKLGSAGVLSIRFTGGDFLFREDAVKILRHADRSGISFHLLSDTVAFSDRALEEVASLDNLAYIGSSIDGHTAAVHDEWRGPGAFDLLLSRVSKIAEAGIPVSLGATLHKGNYRNVRDIGQIASRAGATFFEVGFLTPVGRGKDLATQVLDGPEVREALDLYLDGVRAGEYRPLQGHYLRRAGAERPFADIESFIDVLPYLTEWPYSRMRVKPSGVTYTAGRLKATPFAMGVNLLSEDVRTVWTRSPNLAYLRSIAGGCRLHSLDFRTLPMELRYG